MSETKIQAHNEKQRDILCLALQQPGVFCNVRQWVYLQHLGLWIQHNVSLSKQADINHLLFQRLCVPL